MNQNHACSDAPQPIEGLVTRPDCSLHASNICIRSVLRLSSNYLISRLSPRAGQKADGYPDFSGTAVIPAPL